ncbi:hypothetical protein DFH07DRAFT_865453 [Mycena maculata]|uniref:DUF3669 domain-containing protein n=1 Tax=Mycena maculata TaxID=230809 RepID=A0AAD7NX85_9AGAR|nr:hypothetical protein DFH07DRAFT_865453 [Mycena maculata]
MDPGSLEALVPIRIGAGSFATIYATPGLVQAQKHASQIEKEFEALHVLYNRCNSNSIFAIPRTLAFYNPENNQLRFFPPSPSLRRPREPRATLRPEDFAGLPKRASYLMDRAAPLPQAVGEFIRTSFYTEKARMGVPPPLICRLYFGKELRPSAFINPNNFPIDVARYKAMQTQFGETLFTLDEAVEGIGEMLSRVHWIAGFDARDVEFAMAGSPLVGAVRYYIIDFNQMCPFSKENGQVTELADAFFTNDPYYPRPVRDDPLYVAFKHAYMQACPEDFRSRASLFLEEIEQRYAASGRG